MIKRTFTNIYKPHREQGFLGAGHTARALLVGDFKDTDPFILLMDDDLNKQDGSPVGGRHPHAGFETVSLQVDGEIVEMMESMKKGDFQVMTAGSGIVHTETINEPVKGRLFQMWLNLPKKDRWTTPRLQILPAEKVPSSEKDGISIRVYSGSLAGLTSPIQNYVPLIAAEITMAPGLETTLDIPANFRTFLVGLSGSVQAEGGKEMSADEVAWLDYFDEDAPSQLTLKSGTEGVRLVLYAAKPLGEEMVSHGPFIADRQEEIQPLYHRYRLGGIEHIADVPEEQRLRY